MSKQLNQKLLEPKLSVSTEAPNLCDSLAEYQQKHQDYIAQNLSLDLTRGKPCKEQLELSNDMLNAVTIDQLTETTDLRNYGGANGIPEAKELFGEFLDIPETERLSNVFVGGNSSLSLMHAFVSFALYQGIQSEDQPWSLEAAEKNDSIKMLCPVPGYDRHFGVCTHLGIEMIPVKLTGDGPDIDQIKALVNSDPLIKGIWCVPRFSNPTGETYSNEVVEQLASIPSIAGKNFYILWDNAYALHALNSNAKTLNSIDSCAKKAGTSHAVIQFGSTSKITFAGAGLGYMASSAENIAGFTKHFGMTSIGPDKINQLRHVNFLKSKENTLQHMQAHAEIIGPKFELANNILRESFSETNLCEWQKPDGGYFISVNTHPGLATRVIALAAEAGVKLTPAGSTYPEFNDPDDKNIRIAPTFPSETDLKTAMEVFTNCIFLASAEQKA